MKSYGNSHLRMKVVVIMPAHYLTPPSPSHHPFTPHSAYNNLSIRLSCYAYNTCRRQKTAAGERKAKESD